MYSFKLPTMAIDLIVVSPSDIPLNIAVLSAQFVAPKDAFSTLHPPYIFPLSKSTAAPTFKIRIR
ncbi:hypothetical protein DFH90_002029 [Clostridium saccharobutylicum]|nr:hypothetical protein [Clostridium saccharobutylicum]